MTDHPRRSGAFPRRVAGIQRKYSLPTISCGPAAGRPGLEGLPMSARILLAISAAVALAAGLAAPAEAPGDIRELKLRDWQPRSMMVTKTTVVEKPRYPVVDMHNHLGGGKERLTPRAVERYLTEMNEAGVRTLANLACP